jgi:hypothetical protein
MKCVLPVATLAGFLICTSATYATPEYMKKEKKACTFCHAKAEPQNKEAMQKNLTDAGKYYATHNHSLVGYTPKK